MAQKIADAQAGFAGGLNTVGDPSLLRPDQARLLTNCKLNVVGAATKRLGTQKVSATAPAGPGNACAGGTYWYFKKMALLFGADAGKTLLAAGTGTLPITWNGIAAASGTTMSDAVPFVGPDAAEWLYMPVSGVSTLYRWDGAGVAFTASTGTLPAAIDALIVYNDRLWGWIAFPGSQTNLIYYSPLATTVGSIGGDGLGVAASGGGAIAIRTFGASAIRTCAVIGTSLLIFHVRGVSRLTGFGQDDTQVEPQAVSDSISVISRRGVSVAGDIGYAITTDGLYRVTEGGVAPVATPDKPDPTVAAIKSAVGLLSYSTCVYNDATQEVWVSIPTGGASTSSIYVYNTLIDAWSGPFNGTYAGVTTSPYGAAIFRSFDTVQAANSNFIAQTWLVNAGDVYLCDAPYYKDGVAAAGTGGSAYTSTIQCHRMFANERTLSKTWRLLSILASIGDTGVDPVVTVSGKLGTSTTTVAVTATAQDVYYVRPGTVGPYVDVTITDAGTSASQYVSVGAEGFILGVR